MKPGSKYHPLYLHLSQSGQEEVTLSIPEIERLIGTRLPRSARTTRGWWSNRERGAV